MNRYYQDGQVYRRGKRVKKWKERLRIYYDDGSVKRPEVVLGFCSRMAKSEARTKLRERISQSGSKPSPVLHEITFGEYWRTTTFPYAGAGERNRLKRGYKGYMKFLILPTMQHVALKDIVFLANYFAGLRGRWGFWTTRKIRMLLKSIFEEAGNDDLINKNPMRRLPLPSTADPDKPGLREWQAQARGPCRRHAGPRARVYGAKERVRCHGSNTCAGRCCDGVAGCGGEPGKSSTRC